MHTDFWYKNVKENGKLGDLDVCGIILKWILKKQDWNACTGFIWLRMGTGGKRAVVNAVMNHMVPYNAGNVLTSLRTNNFSKKTVAHGVGWSVGQSVM